MNSARVLHTVMVVAAVTLSSGVVLAEPTMADKSESHSLFERGLAEYKKSSYEEALKLFLGSEELDPGVGTLLYIGECYKQLGKPASAWGAFKEASTLAQRLGDKRGDIAVAKAAEVEGARSYLTIEVPNAARVVGLEVKRDGKSVPSALWSTSVPVDPGSYTIEASAPGRVSIKNTVQVGEKGAKATYSVAVLQALPTTKAETSAPPGPRADAATAPLADGDAGSSGPWRTVGLVGAGVGLTVGVVGAVMMKGASSKADTARANHDTSSYDDAKSSSSTGTVLLVGGLVVLAGGVVLAVVDPGSKPASSHASFRVMPCVGPGFSGIALGGAY